MNRPIPAGTAASAADTTSTATGDAAGPPAPGRSRTWAWTRRHPGMVVLLVAPVVVFLAPELVGRVFLDGDNLIQNFPLRVLVGRNLRAGDLPLLNPYLYGGTPLLAGFNAGAAYPTTWLLAVLPQFLAWGLNLALAYDVAIAGMYLFLRRQRLDVTAATLGAALYACTGYLAGQLVHIDLILGAGWLPWALLGIHQLTRPLPPGTGRRHGHPVVDLGPWVLLLGGAVGLSLLSGGAEVFIDGAELMGLYALWRLGSLLRWGDPVDEPVGERIGDALQRLVALLAAAGLGLGLGAAQWIPGLVFQSSSQRGQATYHFFTSGSLNFHLLDLLVSPFAQGSNQGFAAFVGQYNFPEVVSYVGIFPLVAALVLPTRRWRGRAPGPQWFWYAVIVLGIFSALGYQTFFGHLLFLVPGVNRQRLLNRNLLLVDIALVVLGTRWMHVVLRGRTGGAAVGRARDRPPAPAAGPDRPGRLETVLTCLPAALIVATALALWVDGGWVLSLLDTSTVPSFGNRLGLVGLSTAMAVVACFGTWVALVAGRRSPGRRRRLVAAVVVCDVLVFLVGGISGITTFSQGTAAGPAARALTAATGDGRFLVYDPDLMDQQALISLGQTDLNIFNRVASAQGYAALVDGRYATATGAHLQETLDPQTLADQGWDDLNTTVFLSLPGYFLTPAPVPGPGSPPRPLAGTTPVTFPQDLRQFVGAPVETALPSTVGGGDRRVWYLGGVLTVGTWDVPVGDPDGGAGPHGLQAGIVDRTGAVRWLPAGDARILDRHGRRTMEVHTGGVAAAGVVVRNAGARSVTVGVPTAVTAEAGTVSLDGRLQAGVTSPHWRFTGTIDGFAVFANSRARGWAWATAPDGGAASPATTVTAAAPPQNGVQHIRVTTSGPVTVVRSMTFASSWRATLARAGGRSRSVPIARDGLVQGVAIPGAGTWVVTFRYASPSALWGVAISAATFVVGVVGAVLLGRRRRRRRRQTASAPA